VFPWGLNMTKIKVAVIYGGRSGEHEVSLVSALSVMKHIDTKRYEVIPIAIDKQGQWWLNQYPQVAESDQCAMVKDSHSKPVSLVLSKQPDPTSLQALCDVVFPVLHGPGYEDGAIQGLFVQAGLPFVGCSVLSAAVGMDKHLQKTLAKAHGITVLDSHLILPSPWQKNSAQLIAQLEAQFAYPMFVKPNSLGSSVSNAKVKTKEALQTAIENAFQYDNAVLVEPYVKAREIELSLLCSSALDNDPLVSVAGEIVVADSGYEFYSYTAKYAKESTVGLVIPAELAEKQVKEVQDIARQVFKALRCDGMARVDLFYVPETETFYFNEINTIPGFTSISMYPKLWEASGFMYRDLLTRLIELAFERQAKDLQLQRDWQ
jgi:D-alanine-D-alanine ligase